MFIIMISAHIMGGLGNQLFIIFTCISSAWENNTDFIFYDDSKLSISHGSPRPTYWNDFLWALKRFTTKHIPGFTTFHRSEHHYVKLPKIQQNITLHGYFQSYKYFQSYQDKIYKLIGIHDQRVKIKQLYPKYFHTHDGVKIDNIVSLHFRIGDFKHIQNAHYILTIEYYIAAINEIIKQLNDAHLFFICFSEKQDEEIINKNIQQLRTTFPTCLFASCDYTMPDWQQLLLMSCCHHHILANSTFSWWAAYLNDYKSKRVIYPNKWFGPHLNHLVTTDMFPPNWCRMMED